MDSNEINIFDKEATNSEENVKRCKNITFLGMIVNIFLTVIKILAGWFGNSNSVMADGLHSFSDLSTDIAVIIGVKYWNQPPDEDHPYGHRRIEAIVSAFIASALAIAGLLLGIEALKNLKSGVHSQPESITLIVAIISIISKEIIYQMTYKTGKEIKSPALIANAWHHRSDSLSSIPVALAIGIAIYKPSWSFIDSVATIVVSGFILETAWEISSPAFKELSDGGAKPELLKQIEEIVLNVEGVKSIHKLRTRYYGSGLYVDLHVQVDGNMTVTECHNITGKAKHRLFEANSDIVDVLIHVEPTEKQ